MSLITKKNILFQATNIIKQYFPPFAIEILKNIKYDFLNIYRIYKYNLSFVEKKEPKQIIKNLYQTTQKIFSPARKTILFYPNFPYHRASIYQLCLALGYHVTQNPQSKFDAAIYWKRYATFFPENPILSSFIAENKTVINDRCQDISKSYIDEVFLNVFGYCISVDPLKYTGKCVAKSDLNARHDGKIIDCPISSKQSKVVYQKLIENEIEPGKLVEFRVPIFKQTIPLVYTYLKNISNAEQRFLGYPNLISVEITEASQIFTSKEIDNILEFCSQIGLDYGELDILKDKQDNKIYIIDANNTPSSTLLLEPVIMSAEKCLLSYEERASAIDKLIKAFQAEILNTNNSDRSSLSNKILERI
ncbi:MAG: hypothetical protein QNJ38_09535 [Prochloraceae cyanobacterium]|nr:hypothetical protein [Prochloraceae cyanobacterium]